MVPIVVVDDAREDLVFAQRVLAANRIQNPIHLLSSGKDCLDYFMGKTSIPPDLPCIVLLDMVMKPMSGLEVLRRLQKLPAARNSVLIMLSGLANTKTIAEGYKLGARTFLFKPLVSNEFTQMLKAVYGLILTQTSKGAVLSIVGNPSRTLSEHAENRFPSPS